MNRIIAIDQRRTIQAVHRQVKITVIVQVRQAHALRDLGRIKTPGPPDFRERQIAAIVEGKNRSFEFWKERSQTQLFAPGHWLLLLEPLDAAGDIDVLGVAPVTGCNQQVLESIQVRVQKDRTPGPFGRFDAAELRNLGVGAVAAVPEQRVPRILRAALRFTAWQGCNVSPG